MKSELHSTARAIVEKHRGILAADESTGTIQKRFDKIGVENTADNRRDYRELLFRAKGWGQFVSGVILYDETLRQSAKDGTPLARLIREADVLPGIKVDKGAVALAGAPNEKVTDGLDGLRERLVEYRDLGARFAKWRAVITIGAGIPTPYCLDVNAHALARYAALCQEQGIVPIVEPEVLMDADNTIETCYEVTLETLTRTFAALRAQRVDLQGMLLKPNMVIAGKLCKAQADSARIAELTLRCFHAAVPAAVPGIVFLSGGQSEIEATANLNAMNAAGALPWKLSFSYGRALQDSALKAWKGQAKNVPAAQAAFLLRAKCNALACAGKYTPANEKAA
jgi:fructose-bisphosphate aldolase class I